jgi:cobalamin biosynthesis Mg chelatase CobN
LPGIGLSKIAPKLITDWLYSKVSFEPAVSTEAKAEIADQEQKEQVLADGDQAADTKATSSDQELSANGARSPIERNELEQQEQVGTATTTSSQTTAPASTVATLETESAEAANSDASSNGDSNKNGQVTKPTVTSSAIVLAPSRRDQNKHNAASQSTPEVERLRQQVRLLTGALVGVICVFSGGVIWLGYQLDLKPNDIFSGQTQTTLIKKHSVSQ